MALVELILAAVVGNSMGIGTAVGLGVLVACCGIAFFAPVADRCGPAGWAALPVARGLVGCSTCVLSAFCFLLLVAHAGGLAANPGWEVFPESCSKPACTRVTLENPQRAGNRPLLWFRGQNSAEVRQELRRWATERVNWPEACEWVERGPEEQRAGGLARAFCRTARWGFVDDVAWELSAPTCGGSSGVLVEVHSESRIGQGDMGLNSHRVNAIWRFLRNGTKAPVSPPVAWPREDC